MLLWEAMSFPPKTVPAQSGRGLTPKKALHSSEKAWKFHSSGSNMSWTPSVHMGITISVQAWGWGIEHAFILTGKAAQWHICAVIYSAWQALRSVLPHLVSPAKETEAAGCCLRYVETGRTSSVVVVDLRCLGDTVQQLIVRHSGIESQILANHLEITKNNKQNIK